MNRLLLAILLLFAVSVQAVDVEAIRTAAEGGNVAAMTTLGGMYHRGLGVPQSDVEATTWYLLAAGQGHAGAQSIVGMMFLLNGEESQARYWLRRAAAQGDPAAQRQLDLLRQKPTGE